MSKKLRKYVEKWSKNFTRWWNTQKAKTLYLTSRNHFENESYMHKQQDCNICYPCNWKVNKDSSCFPTSYRPTSRNNFPKRCISLEALYYSLTFLFFHFNKCGNTRACKLVCTQQQQKKSSLCKKKSGKTFLFLALILRCLASFLVEAEMQNELVFPNTNCLPRQLSMFFFEAILEIL